MHTQWRLIPFYEKYEVENELKKFKVKENQKLLKNWKHSQQEKNCFHFPLLFVIVFALGGYSICKSHKNEYNNKNPVL